MLKWKDNVERLLNEYSTNQIDKCKNVQSNAHSWLNTIGDSSLSPVGKVLKYDLDKSICRVSLIRNKFLSNSSVSLGNKNQQNEKDFHRFLTVFFLYKVIVAKPTCQKDVIYSMDYCIERLNKFTALTVGLAEFNKIDLMIYNSLLYYLQYSSNEKMLLLKTILEREKSLFLESKLLVSEKSVGSSTELEPAVNPTSIGLPRIEPIRAGFSSNALSITGKQFWNLFLHDLNRGGGSARDIGRTTSRYIYDQVNKLNFLDDSPVRNCAGSNFIPKMRRNPFFIGRCNSSYLDVLENFYAGSEDEAISSKIISFIHPQLSDSLSSNFSKQAAGEPIQLLLFNLHKSAALVTHSDGLSYSISDLKRLLASLNSSPRETIESFSYLCSSDRVSLEEMSKNSGSWSDRRPRYRSKNLLLDRVYQKNLSIRYFWEPEEMKTSYWSLRLPLCDDVTPRSLAESIVKEVAHEDTDFADQFLWKEATRSSHFINFNELLKDLTRYKISWIFWKNNIGEKWSLFLDYIPWFFTPTWWRYFYDLIRETYPEIVLKISYDLTHDFSRISKVIAEDVVDGAKAYLLHPA